MTMNHSFPSGHDSTLRGEGHQAFCSLQISPGARRYYDKQRARDLDYNPALRQLGNRLVGILHGCLKTRTLYDEATAWSHHATLPAAA